ncbi:YceI family protein [Candidatus Uhrbacteria bacterium]|nr:YceI family protein [Candidatus Uhrbacteria bacterium]
MILIGAGCTQPQETPEPLIEEAASEIRFVDGTYLLDLQTGLINWEASKVVAKHNGTIQAQDGSLQIENGQVVSGTLSVYMNSIKDLDLKDEKLNATLVKHLESEDFFSVASNPTAMFTLLEVVPVEGLPGMTHRITGNMTIKGIENKISFPAKIETTQEGIRLAGTMELDRTLWDIKYGSEKFFDNLGDNLISDIFTLQFNLLFTRDTVSLEQRATISEAVCYFEDKMLFEGESYDDGCNTHTCQRDGTIFSTEKACETE